MADIKKRVYGCDDFDREECTSSSSSSSDQREIIYLAATNLSKQIREDAGCGSNPPAGTLTDPKGLLVNPVFGTPDGISVIEINEAGIARVVPQPQLEGTMQVAPFRAPNGALVYDAEAHHFVKSEDNERIIAFGIVNSFAYVFDISGDHKKYPKLIHSVDLTVSGYTGPHDALELDDGTFLVTLTGQAKLKPQPCAPPPLGPPSEGFGPGGMIRITRDGAFINDVTQPVDHTMFTSGAISIAIKNKLLAYPEFQTHFYFDSILGSPCEAGHNVVLFEFDPKNPGILTNALQTIPLEDTAGNSGLFSTSPTWWPGTLKGADGRKKDVLFATAISAGLFALTRNHGTNDPFVAQLIIALPIGPGYPQHAAMHAITFSDGTKDKTKNPILYLTDTWGGPVGSPTSGGAIWQMDMSNGLPPVGTYFTEGPGTYSVKRIDCQNIHWAEFNRKGNYLYTSNTLFSFFDWILCKYPPNINRVMRRFDVDTETGDVSLTPSLIVQCPDGYGWVKAELRRRAKHPKNIYTE